jgi:hypothetical protein
MIPRLRCISYQEVLCLLTTGKYWKIVRTVVYAAGVGGKNSAMDGRDAHEVDRAVPMVRGI